MTSPKDHDACIAAAPEALQPLLSHLRQTLREALRGLDEIMRYDMPGFGKDRLVAVGYGAFSKQCGLYVSKSAIAAHAEAIASAGLKASKTGVTFSPAKPPPNALIVALAHWSREDVGL